jgi:hypothetical protein
MVKTRQQQAKQSQCSTQYETGVQTRSGARKLERVELPTIILSKEMKKRFQIKKAITKKTKEIQIEQKLRKSIKYHKQFKAHHQQTNDEMLAVWKNLDSAFELIDGLCKFRDRVEGRC